MKTCRICRLKENKQTPALYTQIYRLNRRMLDKVAVCQAHRNYFSPNYDTFQRQLKTLAEFNSIREAQAALDLKKKALNI